LRKLHFTKWPDFCNDFRRIRGSCSRNWGRKQTLEERMNKASNGTFGIIIGGVVAVIAAIFILTGGELGGKKTVEGDQDLPPVATTDK
jgi:hypothetical protein